MKSFASKLMSLYRTRRWVRWPIDLGLVMVLVVAVGAWQTRHHARGVALPAVTLTALDGRSVPLASLTGKPTLVAIWAPWCGVCRATSDNVARVAKLGEDRVQVVSIALAYESRAAVERYVAQNHVEYPVLLGDDAVGQRLAITSFPTFYVLDADGHIVSSAVGYTTTLGLLWRLL